MLTAAQTITDQDPTVRPITAQDTTVRRTPTGEYYAHCPACGPITTPEPGLGGDQRMAGVAELHDLLTHQDWTP